MASILVEATTTTNRAGASVLVDTQVDCGIDLGGDLFEPDVAEPGVGAEDQPFIIPDECALLTIETDISTEKVDQIMPGSSLGSQARVQRVGWRVKLDGVALSAFDLLNQSISVSRSLDRPIQVASFSAIALDGRSPLGDPMRLGAPITGLRAIDIAFAYRTAIGTEFEEPLITNGIAQSSGRSIGSAIIDDVDVADGGWRFINKTIDLSLPAGSRTRRDELIRKFAAAASVPSIRISGFRGTVTKGVQLVKGDWHAMAQAHGEIEGGHLLWDRFDDFVAKFDAPEKPLGVVRWWFTPEDIVVGINGSAAPMQIDPAPEGWTRVKLRGTKQVESDQATCGKSTVELPFSNLSVFSARVHLLEQQAGASLSVVSSGVTPLPATKQIRAQSVAFVTRECEEVVATRTISERFYNLKRARFVRNGNLADLPITSYARTFVDNANEGIGYRVSTWRLMVTEIVDEAREFDVDGFLVRETREVRSFYVQRRAQKSRTAFGDPWDVETAQVANLLDLGDGQMVTQALESFILTERKTIIYTNDNGYLRQREETRKGFGRIPGHLFLYHDGEFGQLTETFQALETIIETWDQIPEGLVRYTRIAENIKGEVDSQPGTVTIGQPPAAVRRTQAEPSADDFSSPEELEAAVSASAFEQQSISADCSAPALENVRPVKVLENAFWEHAETAGELQDLCTRTLLFGMGAMVTWTVPANGRVEEGDVAYVRGPQGSGIDHVVLVTEVLHSGDPLGPITTTLRGISYPDESVLPYINNPSTV